MTDEATGRYRAERRAILSNMGQAPDLREARPALSLDVPSAAVDVASMSPCQESMSPRRAPLGSLRNEARPKARAPAVGLPPYIKGLVDKLGVAKAAEAAQGRVVH